MAINQTRGFYWAIIGIMGITDQCTSMNMTGIGGYDDIMDMVIRF